MGVNGENKRDSTLGELSYWYERGFTVLLTPKVPNNFLTVYQRENEKKNIVGIERSCHFFPTIAESELSILTNKQRSRICLRSATTSYSTLGEFLYWCERRRVGGFAVLLPPKVPYIKKNIFYNFLSFDKRSNNLNVSNNISLGKLTPSYSTLGELSYRCERVFTVLLTPKVPIKSINNKK